MDQDQATQRFYESVWPHRTAVLRAARILTGNEAESEDLAQETLIKAFKGIGRFAPGTDAKAWLLTILRRARIDRLRSAAAASGTMSLDALEVDPADRNTGADEPHVFAGWDGTPEQLLEAFSDHQVIQGLQALPEEIRLTLLLVDVEQLKLEEAAQILEVPVGTVKSRTHRGRAMLRQSLLPVAREMRLVP